MTSARIRSGAFWPRQEFDFSQGGEVVFDVNIENRRRHWFEVQIMPADQLTVGAADEEFPIDETYPTERIVFDFFHNKRRIHVGNGEGAAGEVARIEEDVYTWALERPDDPANSDRRIRRTNKLSYDAARNEISWAMELADGSFDTLVLPLNERPSFTRGLVLFSTHSYTPGKDQNVDQFTFHWDNIGFTGPTVGRYEVYEAADGINLERNGDRPIGDTATNTINLPSVPADPSLFGQLHYGLRGQVLLSINGAAPIAVEPHRWSAGSGDCWTQGWSSFMVDLDPAQLRAGENTFEWTVGPRPDCADALPFGWGRLLDQGTRDTGPLTCSISIASVGQVDWRDAGLRSGDVATLLRSRLRSYCSWSARRITSSAVCSGRPAITPMLPPDRILLAFDLHRLIENTSEAALKSLAIQPGGLRREHRELVTAKSAHHMAAVGRGEPGSDFDQHSVACRVTESVIDDLEVIQVDEAHEHPRRCGQPAHRQLHQ